MKIKTFFLLAGYMVIAKCGFSQVYVNSTGKVGINNSSPSYQLDVSGNFRANSTYQLTYSAGKLSNSSQYSYLGKSGKIWGTLHVNDAYVYLNFVGPSDRNLKTDINDIPSIGTDVLKLKPVKYKMKPRFEGDAKADSVQTERAKEYHNGFIAQDLQEVFPELVVTDQNGMLGIKYIEIIPLVVKAFQEQQAQIEELKKRIEALEEKTK